MKFDNLKDMSRDELVVLAMKQGLPKPHHKTSAENIIKLIVDTFEHPATKSIDAQVEKKSAVFASKEQIELLVSPLKQKNPKFETIYDDEAKCVTFRYNGAEDCMSMSVSPRWMYEKAKLINRGRLALKGHTTTNFDHGNATGHNAYTNVVLA